MATASSEPAKLATGTAEMPTPPSDQLNVIASIAPSAAPAETPSVNGVASGLRSSPWNTTPAAASSAPTQRAGERARQPRDEEDLRVDVVGERDRRVEGAAQADRRRADERREQSTQRERAEAGERRPKRRCSVTARGTGSPARGGSGTTTRCPAA